MGKEELISLINKKESQINYIYLYFSDLIGNEKQVVINKKQIYELLEGKIFVDSSEILGLLSVFDDEYMIMPDLNSLSINNTEPDRFISMNCKLYEINGSIHELDVNSVKSELINSASNLGIAESELFEKYFSNNQSVVPIYKS